MNCYNCSSDIEVTALKPLGFRDTCPKCDRDAHVCRNCELFDESAHHQCRESSAELVRDKERANRCEYFSARAASTSKKGSSADHVAALEGLFKKG
jgi:hypothetical protein